jgi:hypothetical protein
MSIEISREGLIRLRGNPPLFSRASVTCDRTTYIPMEVMTRQATYFVSEECKQIHKDAMVHHTRTAQHKAPSCHYELKVNDDTFQVYE